jgi:sec-independent protein translocase protein TatC
MGKKQEKKKKKRLPDPLETTMSLGDHLEELRARLILAILGLVIGTIISLTFGRRIIQFIERPYSKVMARHHQVKVEKELKDTEAPNASAYLLNAFTTNLLKALQGAKAPAIDPNAVKFVQKIYVETLAKLAHDPNYVSAVASERSSSSDTDLKALGPADPFVAYMKITLISGLIVSSPWVFYQLWMFIAAGLYEQERKYVRTAVPFSTVLFVTGALFFLFIIAPLCLRFFLNFGEFIGVTAIWTFDKYISFVTMLMLVFGIAFQTPIAIFVLTRTGLISIETFKKSRKYVIVGVFLIAGLATPPDVISQFALAIPLYTLFELGILLSWLAQRKQNSQQPAD